MVGGFSHRQELNGPGSSEPMWRHNVFTYSTVGGVISSHGGHLWPVWMR